MTFVDHLKGVRGEDLFLEVAFGRHMITGDLAKSVVTGSDPTHVVTVQQLLGDALGKGWEGPEGLWFRGTHRDSTKYKFYPGIMSPGNADSVQGIDSVFDEDTPHSNTAWIRCELPNGSEIGIPDFDTKESPPTGLSGIYRCQLGDTYSEIGEVVDSDVLLVNPADVIAFGCKVIRRYDDDRIDWQSLDALRLFCDEEETPDYTLLPAGVGLTGKYYDGAAFGTLKSQRVDPVIQYDTSTGAPALDIDPEDFSVRFEGKIRFKYTETYTMYLTHNETGKLWIDNLTTPLIDEATAGEHSDTFAATADQWYDIKIEWTNSSGDSEFKLEWQSATQARRVVSQDRLYPKAEPVPRFRCNIAFLSRTTFDAFLRAVLFTCNGNFQDAGGKLRFFSIDQLTAGYAFDQSNIVKNQLKFYPRYTQQELLQLPNRFVAEGRDLDSRYLERFDPQLFYDVPGLQEMAGRIIEETVLVGNTTRWQGLKNLAHHARLKHTPWVAEFEGMPQTLGVLPGDIVTVTHPKTGWTAKEFLTIEATDKSVDKDVDLKIFKLYSWDD